MSVRIMSQVWDHGPEQPHLRLLLLALADNANDHGVCWPSIKTLARKCAVEPRTVQRSLRTLEDQGWIKSEQRPGHSTNYLIRGDADVRVTPTSGVTSVSGEGVTPTSGEGRRGRHPEPSVTTISNHQSRSRSGKPF